MPLASARFNLVKLGDINAPEWNSPAAGSLGIFTVTIAITNITLQATDPEGAAVTLTITSGSLPSGISMTDNGNGTATISGTPTFVSSETVSSFTVTAEDEAGNQNGRAFSMTVRPNYWGDSSDGTYSNEND